MSSITDLKIEALDRIGGRIDAAWNRLRQNKDAWIEASFELAQALREGRIHCGDNDTAFGAWLKQTGRDYVSKDDRAVLIKAAANPAAMRDVMTKTKSRSYQMTFRSATKGRRKRKSVMRVGKPQITINVEPLRKENDALRKENKELRDKIWRLESLLSKRGVFTKAQFRQLQMCVHPDSSASISVRNELTSFIVQHARQLVRPN